MRLSRLSTAARIVAIWSWASASSLRMESTSAVNRCFCSVILLSSSHVTLATATRASANSFCRCAMGSRLRSKRFPWGDAA